MAPVFCLGTMAKSRSAHLHPQATGLSLTVPCCQGRAVTANQRTATLGHEVNHTQTSLSAPLYSQPPTGPARAVGPGFPRPPSLPVEKAEHTKPARGWSSPDSKTERPRDQAAQAPGSHLA